MGSELRQDPLRGDQVILAPGRASRPNDFAAVRPPARSREFCDFCQGNESATPAEILVRRSDGDSRWSIRVIPNKYPALAAEGEASGVHEVIIESPRHVQSLTDLTSSQVREVLSVYRERLTSLRGDSRLAYGVIFKNSGPAAGASMEHVHSQLVGLAAVPDRIAVERGRLSRAARCILCEQIDRERSEGRCVIETARYFAYAPFASRFPYEVLLVPKPHEATFEEQGEEALSELAGVFRRLLAGIEKVAPGAGYNYVLHTEPFGSSGTADSHWRVEMFPRLTRVGGFEWGTGTFINTVSPEEASQRLREITESDDER